jgi:hypothetical protein
MKDCGYIQKDKKNTFHGYSYASEAAIKDRVHAALVEHGVIQQISLLGLTEREITRTNAKGQQVSEWLTTANVHYKFYCCDTGEFIEGTFYGCGVDPSDKGLYKAITGAIKYLLTSQFLIPTGDDPENEEGRTASKEEKQGKQQEYLRSKGIDPAIPPKHQHHQPPPDVRTASEQHKALIVETAKMLDEPPQTNLGIDAAHLPVQTERTVKSPITSIEMRHAATVAETDAVLKEVAKPPAKRKRGAISFTALKKWGELKLELRALTGTDNTYYAALQAKGYSHADEINSETDAISLWRVLGNERNRLKQEKENMDVLAHAAEVIGQRAFSDCLGVHGAESLQDALNLSGDAWAALLAELKELVDQRKGQA